MTEARTTRLAALAEDILAKPARITLIDALPGTGKSTLLDVIARRTGTEVWRRDTAPPARQGGAGDQRLCLIDLAPGSQIDLGDIAARVIVVAQARQIRGHARLRVYGALREIANRELFLDPAATPGFDDTCGWPALVAHFRARPDDHASVVAFLRDTVLPRLSDDAGTAMLALARSRRGLRDDALSAGMRAALSWLRPLVARDAAGMWTLRGAGFAALLREAARDAPDTPALRRVIEDAGDTVAAVQSALAAGQRRRAVTILERAGGMMLGHLQGPAEARAVLDAFSDEPHPGVAALRIMTAMKAGQSGHASRLLDAACAGHARTGGAEAASAGALAAPPATAGLRHPSLPAELRLLRLLMGIYSDRPLDTAFHSEYFALLAEVAPDTYVLRGAIYNVALDAQIRAGRRGEAQATARRALEHYRAAEAPYLAFYIHVHLALMHLSAGDPSAATPELESADRELAATRFETPQDDRFLTLLRAQVAYEQGRPEAMAAFAESAFDDFAYGELWPSIASQALAFGAEALLHLRGTDAALRYLEGWRVQMWRTRRFRLLIEQREVLILQSARRWREARLKLEVMATRIGRIWICSAGENLADLNDPEDMAQALLWLRQSALDRPRDRALAERLSHAARNPNLSWRQARCVAIWQAWAARRRGKVSEARQMLADTLGACAARHCTAPVIEERVFVAALLADPRMRGGPMTAAPAPPALRRGGTDPARTSPLSRQETRAMHLLAEGCNNKDIARDMAISLPTVKFHLRNIYAKLEVCDRRAAVAEARARRLLED